MPDMTGFNANNELESIVNTAFFKIDTQQTLANSKFNVHSNNDNSSCCFLNILKPKGITSFDVVYKLRKLLKIKKIGHSGTLDPLAEGVMQVAIGQATRLIDYLGSDKKYVANIKFGYISETGDAEGEITPVNPPNFTYNELLAAINSLTGEIEQVPPVYSAIKVDGKKLCDLARAKSKKNKTIKNEPNLKIEKTDQNQSPMPEIPNQSRENPYHPGQNTDIETLKPSDDNNSAHLTMPQYHPSKTLQMRFNHPSNAEFMHICADGDKILDKNLECDAKSSENFDTNKINNDLLSNIKIPKRNVTIYEAKVLSFVTIDDTVSQVSEIEIEIFCSKGTYIRSFAMDLAAKLNTGAYLTALKRTLAGNFSIENSVKIEDVCLQKHGINPILALDLPVYELSADEYEKVLNGVAISPQTLISPQTPISPQTTITPQTTISLQTPITARKNPDTIILSFDNNLVSVAHLRDNKIVPKKVFK